MCKLTSCAPAAGKPAVSQLQNGGKSLKWEGDVRGGCDGVLSANLRVAANSLVVCWGTVVHAMRSLQECVPDPIMACFSCPSHYK